MDNNTYDLLVNDKFIRQQFVIVTLEVEVEDDGRLFPKDAPIG